MELRGYAQSWRALLKRKSLEGWISRILPLDVSFDGLTQEDIDAALIDHHAIPLLFGRISAANILEDLHQRGLEQRLAEKGYHDLKAELAQVGVGQEALQITASHSQSRERQRLMELKAFWGKLSLPDGTSSRALVWDWLELRDPMAEFRPSRPPLPGQTAPGLSMFHDLVELMRHYVSQTDAEALVTIPQHFHNAVLYQKESALRYRFLDPLRQGQLEAQMRDLMSEKGGLYSASWAFAENRVEMLAPDTLADTGRPYRTDEQAHPGASDWVGFAWTPSELVLPLTETVKVALDSQEALKAEGLACRFRIVKTPNPDIEGSFHLGT